MNLYLAASSVETGEAISSFLQHNFSLIAGILLGVALLIGLALIVARYIEGWKYESELAELQDLNMELHDTWRASASHWRFEVHKRGCRRCRGDLFGQLDFNLPRGVKAYSLQDFRELKAKWKTEAKAELNDQLVEAKVRG